ncbi:radical SAM family heme chaperone HemW [bacterium]|nr:radical SAM family heme chaperone HemW [bacterium]
MNPLLNTDKESVFSLYIHLPFCVRKCPYCAFYSSEVNSPKQMENVILGILHEAEFYASQSPWNERKIHTLFFGGGTPSYPRGELIEACMAGINQLFDFSENPEITIEVNPGTVTSQKIASWKKAGINRISLGVQSLDDKTLRKLGRIHTAEQAVKAWQKLRDAQFDQYSVDLIYGAAVSNPIDTWVSTLDDVLGWNPDHISAYGLTIEPDTPFYEQVLEGIQIKVDEEIELAQYNLARKKFADTGYHHYEVSNWSKPGHHSHHNVSYWDGTAYLPLGPAGHGFDGNRTRFWNHSNTEMWLKSVFERGYGRDDSEELTPEQQFEEAVVLGLRMVDGVEERRLEEAANHAGRTWQSDALKKFISNCYLLRENGILRYSNEGIVLADEIEAQLTG